MNKVDY